MTTVDNAPHNGMELANILVNNLRKTRKTPNSNITFEDLAMNWYRDLFNNTTQTQISGDDITRHKTGIAMFEIWTKSTSVEKDAIQKSK